MKAFVVPKKTKDTNQSWDLQVLVDNLHEVNYYNHRIKISMRRHPNVGTSFSSSSSSILLVNDRAWKLLPYVEHLSNHALVCLQLQILFFSPHKTTWLSSICYIHAYIVISILKFLSRVWIIINPILLY